MNVRGGLPAQAQARSGSDQHLSHSIDAGHEYLRAKRGGTAIGMANILHSNLTTYTTERVGVKQVALAALAISEDQSAWQEDWSHRAEIGI